VTRRTPFVSRLGSLPEWGQFLADTKFNGGAVVGGGDFPADDIYPALNLYPEA
jgi:hypothetical protein